MHEVTRITISVTHDRQTLVKKETSGSGTVDVIGEKETLQDFDFSDFPEWQVWRRAVRIRTKLFLVASAAVVALARRHVVPS